MSAGRKIGKMCKKRTSLPLLRYISKTVQDGALSVGDIATDIEYP